MENPPLISVDELSACLNVPRSWVYSRTRIKGPDQIPHIRVGKYVRFDLDAVMEWLKDQKEVA